MIRTGIEIGVAVYKNEDDEILFIIENLPDYFTEYKEIFEIIENVLEEENKDSFIFNANINHMANFIELIREKNYKENYYEPSDDLKSVFVEFKKVQE